MPTADAYTTPVRIAAWGDEQQLVAATDVDTGVLLLAERPIAFVETLPEEDDVGSWILLESILSSEPIFNAVGAEDLKMTKWSLTRDDETMLEQLADKYGRNPKKLAQLYHRVAANNIRFAGGDLTGYGIWPLLSRSNHACAPNAQLRGTKDQPLVELLLATRPIAEHEAIGWNYFSDPAFLDLDWFARNQRLFGTFQFLCRCARCETERPGGVAEMSRTALAMYFGMSDR